MGGQHRLGGKERHLGVIRYGAQLSVRRGVIADSLFAIGTDNFFQVQEFNGSAKGVADGSAEQASSKVAAQVQVGWDPGKGHYFFGAVGAAVSFAEQDTANWAKFSKP